MAEKRFIKGLFKDTAYGDQPEGSWRHANNMLLNETEGAISNEGGIELSGHLGTNTTIGATNDKVIGAIEVNDDKVILFVTDVVTPFAIATPPFTAPRSEIGVWENGVYTPVFNPALIGPNGKLTNDLTFRETHPIEGTFKIDAKGDLIVYWTDDLNSPRAFNVDRQIRESGNSVSQLYGITSLNLDNIDILNLFPYSGPVPHIWVGDVWFPVSGYPNPHQEVVNEGGGLRTAVYYLAIAYVDDDLVATNYLSVSDPISIVDEFDWTRPTTKKDGADPGNQTSKAIRWRVSNLNVDYKYMRPVIIRKMGEATEAFKMSDIEINMNLAPTPYQEVSFSGTEGISTASVEEVIIDTVAYDTAKTIQQLDNVLYLGNTTKETDLGYQKYANNIKSRSIIKQINPFDEIWATSDALTTGFAHSQVDNGNFVNQRNSYRYIPNITNYRGYMRDEVYAFYIAFIMKDGSMSYAYHIPGREYIEDADYTEYAVGYAARDETGFVQSPNIAAQKLHELSSDARLYHFYDVSDQALGANVWTAGVPRYMGFWNNVTETYPNTDNFEIWDETTFIDVNGVSQNLVTSSLNLTGELKELNVRHHRMPSNDTLERTTITNDLLSEVFPSDVDPTPTPPGTYEGTFRIVYDGTGFADGYTCTPDFQGDTFINSDWSSNVLFRKIYSDSPAAASPPATTVWNSTGVGKFTAQADFTLVTVTTHIQVMNDATSWGIPQDYTCWARIKHTANVGGPNYGGGAGGYSTKIHSARVSTCTMGICSYGQQAYDEFNACPSAQGNVGGVICGTYSVTLMQGETLEVEMAGHASSPPDSGRAHTPIRHNVQQCFGSQDLACGGQTNGIWGCKTSSSYVDFRVQPGGHEEYHDANIKNKVNILGMQFDDIKIPESYKDKIQGFRIYRAKRKYSDRTVLGQSVVIPTFEKTGTLGLCQEAVSPTNLEMATQALSAAGQETETFYACHPWAIGANSYIVPFGTGQNRGQADGTGRAYKNLQFYDFNLLKEKYSLSPATHIKVQYTVDDLTWNGPEINQAKKMLTVLTDPSSVASPDEPYKVKETWGWDEDVASGTAGKNQNCHARDINSAMFVGGRYTRSKVPFLGQSWSLSRVIGQKAKTYLRGDSIFKGASLGFGGDVVNLGGNSSILLGLTDGIELPSVWSQPNLGTIDRWGEYQSGSAFNLVTRTDTEIIGDLPTTPPRHQSYIVNLNAFKTDVYKNIDTQELVWTGYEILEDNLDNFIFDSSGTNISNGDYSTENIIPPGREEETVANSSDGTIFTGSGVFGGDTFIGRCGVSAGYSPLDDQTLYNPEASIHSHIVENSDNIAFRHSKDDNSLYYPGSIAKNVLRGAGSQADFNHIDNLHYNSNYSAENDIRTAFPLPLRDIIQSDFPTRTHRSAKHDTTSIIDNYRVFLANQFKDLPKNRGDLWKLSSFNNLLYFHMEESLFAAQGKQTMNMGDGSEAFVGSGDIFAQDPNEMVQAEGGFGGTQSQWAALTTRYGYFFVDMNSHKVFMMKDQLSEISNLGLETWFQENLSIGVELSTYGFNISCVVDNPIVGFGLTAIYDPKFKRILLTKRDFAPTALFIAGTVLNQQAPPVAGAIAYNPSLCMFQIYFPCLQPVGFSGPPCTEWTPIEWTNEHYFDKIGWTISYYPELGVWGSFHNYVPYIYFNTSTDFYSLTDQYPRPAWTATTLIANHVGTTFGSAGIWKHNSTTNYGIIYQENEASQYTNAQWLTSVDHKSFEFEFIHNEYKGEDTLTAAFNYTLETFNQAGISVLEHGFTSFFIFNTFQMSETAALEYLINIRRIGNNWKVNHFRDMAAIALDNTAGGYYMSTNTNIIGGTNVGTVTTSNFGTVNMFEYDGMFKTANPAYLNLGKTWDLQRKFIDKWVGIRLIYDNVSNNLLNLYATDVVVRKMYR